MRVAFIQAIVAPTREAWFNDLGKRPEVDLTVFALRETLAHRPGWRSRTDASYSVVLLNSIVIKSSRHIPGTTQRDFSHRVVPVNLLWALLRAKPEIVVVTNATEIVLALPARWWQGAKIVLAAEDRPLTYNRLNPLKRILKRWIYRMVDGYCAHSSEARALLGIFGVPENKISFTPWAIDNDAFETWALATPRGQIRARYGLSGTVFIAVSALIPLKGIDHLLEAWAHMPAETRRQASLLIVGDGPERERLMGMVEARGLQRVVFAGRLEPELVAGCLGAADVFVFPTLQDIWGLAVNEAMVAGLPVLCSRYAGCTEDLIWPGENGIQVDPLDTADFSGALEQMILHPERRRHMGMRSKEIINGFTIARSVSSMVSFFGSGVRTG